MGSEALKVEREGNPAAETRRLACIFIPETGTEEK
jgi:hypothetical protein